VYSPKSCIADFKAIKELAQINIAKTNERKPIRLKFLDNLFTSFLKLREDYTLLKNNVNKSF
jgi:hypothetical protein